MFSRVVLEQLKNPSPIRQIMKMADKENVINMGLNPNELISFGGGWVNHHPPDELRRAYVEIANNPELFHKSSAYSATLGLAELREKISTLEKLLYNLNVIKDNIIIGGSSTQLTLDLFKVLLDTGESVLFLDPTYANYIGQLPFVANNIKIQYLRMLDTEQWTYKHYNAELSDKIHRIFEQHHPKLVLFPSPDNPTSQILENRFVIELIKIAKDYNSYVAIDTAYKTQYFSDTYPAYFSIGPHDYENLILIESNSKWGRGLGRRLGWIIATPSIIEALERVQQASILCPDTFHQMALVRYLEYALQDDSLKRYLDQTRMLYKKAAQTTTTAIRKEIGYRYLEPQGGLYTVMEVHELGETFVMKILKNTGVLFVPGVGFGESLRYAVRISYGPLVLNLDQIREGIERVGKFLKR